MRIQRLASMLLCCLLWAIPLISQVQKPASPPPTRTQGVPTTTTDPDPMRDRINRDLARKANEARQQALKNDSAKLLQLAE